MTNKHKPQTAAQFTKATQRMTDQVEGLFNGTVTPEQIEQSISDEHGPDFLAKIKNANERLQQMIELENPKRARLSRKP